MPTTGDTTIALSPGRRHSGRERLAHICNPFFLTGSDVQATELRRRCPISFERPQVDGLSMPLSLVCNEEVRGSILLTLRRLNFSGARCGPVCLGKTPRTIDQAALRTFLAFIRQGQNVIRRLLMAHPFGNPERRSTITRSLVSESRSISSSEYDPKLAMERQAA